MDRAHSSGQGAASIPTETYQPPVLDGNIQHWRESGLYLPEFMRDFHDQKDLFKALQDVVGTAFLNNMENRGGGGPG